MNRVRTGIFFLITSFSSQLLAASPDSSEKISLMILPFSNATSDQGYDYLAESINYLLLPCVSDGQNRIRVVDRQSTEIRHAEKVLRPQAGYNGKAFAADMLLRGSLVQSGNELRINTLVSEIATTKLVYASSLGLSGLTINDTSCRRWQRGLIEAQREDEVFILKAEAFPERAHLLYESIARLKNGETATAISHLFRLSYEYPGEEEIEYWLAKSLFQAELYDLAEIQINDFLKFHSDTARTEELSEILKQARHQRGGTL